MICLFLSYEAFFSLFLVFLLYFSFHGFEQSFDSTLLQRYSLVSDLLVLWSYENADESVMLADAENFLSDFCLVVDYKVLKCDNPEGKVFESALAGDAFYTKVVFLGG